MNPPYGPLTNFRLAVSNGHVTLGVERCQCAACCAWNGVGSCPHDGDVNFEDEFLAYLGVSHFFLTWELSKFARIRPFRFVFLYRQFSSKTLRLAAHSNTVFGRFLAQTKPKPAKVGSRSPPR